MLKKEKILITGASGYIGFCLLKYLRKKNYNIFGLDKKNLKIKNQKKIDYFFKGNINNKVFINKILIKLKPKLIIHLAGESTLDGIKNKKKYIINNYVATKNLISSMKKNKIKKLIFSSTAAVYKQTKKNISEQFKIKPNNVYGSTKFKCEQIIKKNNNSINFIIFRFFNVCSAINYLNIGEQHNPETHLIPLAINKLIKKNKVKIYGNNFGTKDGTCIRDYIHIIDLCVAFEKVINSLLKNKTQNNIYNLGTGNGYSVLEVLKKIISKLRLSKKDFIIYSKKRFGDNPRLVCSYKKFYEHTKWKPIHSKISKIINDEIYWQKKNQQKRSFIY